MQENSIHKSTIQYASYAGLLFFSFLIKKKIKSDLAFLPSEAKQYIFTRCQRGDFVRILVFGAVGFVLLGYLFPFVGFAEFARLCLCIMFMLQVFGILLISKGSSRVITPFSLEKGKKIGFLKLFLPGVNDYARYHQQNYLSPHWRLKEGQFWWLLIMLARACFPRWQIGVGLLMLFLMRICALYFGRDIIPTSIKQKINHLFVYHVDEILLLPVVFYRSWEASHNWTLDLKLLRTLQGATYQSKFRNSWKRILVRGGLLFLSALFSILLVQGFRKLIPFLWWMFRRILLPKRQSPPIQH